MIPGGREREREGGRGREGGGGGADVYKTREKGCTGDQWTMCGLKSVHVYVLVKHLVIIMVHCTCPL